MRVGYTYARRPAATYFEFPRKRSNGTIITAGQAATFCAIARDQAEDDLEVEVGNKPTLNKDALFNAYLVMLNKILALQGGRVTKQENYPNTPIRSIVKGFTNGNCQ